MASLPKLIKENKDLKEQLERMRKQIGEVRAQVNDYQRMLREQEKGNPHGVPSWVMEDPRVERLAEIGMHASISLLAEGIPEYERSIGLKYVDEIEVIMGEQK